MKNFLSSTSLKKILLTIVFIFFGFETHVKAQKSSSSPSVPVASGYILVPGTNTAIKFGGAIQLDMFYDGGPDLGDTVNVETVPLKGVNLKAVQTGHCGVSARASRLSVASLTHTAKGELKLLIETDFFGNGSDSTGYSPRWRHLYAYYTVKSCSFLAGHTDSVFMDLKAIGVNLDVNGILSGPLRQAQFRYIQKLSENLELNVAFEKPNTDYLDSGANLLNNSSVANSTSNSSGNSGMPDITGSLIWSGERGHLSCRGVARRLSVKAESINGYPSYSSNQTAWVLGISGKLNVFYKSGPFFQINGGDGVGRYIPDIEYYSAYFSNPSSSTPNAPSRLDTQTAINGIIGWQQFWTSEIRTNLMTSMTRVRVSPLAQQQTAPFNNQLFKLIGNILYSLNEKVIFGLEILHVRRDTLRNAAGKNFYGMGTRVLGSVIYKF